MIRNFCENDNLAPDFSPKIIWLVIEFYMKQFSNAAMPWVAHLNTCTKNIQGFKQ